MTKVVLASVAAILAIGSIASADTLFNQQGFIISLGGNVGIQGPGAFGGYNVGTTIGLNQNATGDSGQTTASQGIVGTVTQAATGTTGANTAGTEQQVNVPIHIETPPTPASTGSSTGSSTLQMWIGALLSPTNGAQSAPSQLPWLIPVTIPAP
jgi:hypothetical protein